MYSMLTCRRYFSQLWARCLCSFNWEGKMISREKRMEIEKERQQRQQFECQFECDFAFTPSWIIASARLAHEQFSFWIQWIPNMQCPTCYARQNRHIMRHQSVYVQCMKHRHTPSHPRPATQCHIVFRLQFLCTSPMPPMGKMGATKIRFPMWTICTISPLGAIGIITWTIVPSTACYYIWYITSNFERTVPTQSFGNFIHFKCTHQTHINFD